MLEKAPPKPLLPATTQYAAGVYLRRLGLVLTMIAKTDADEEAALAAVHKRFAEKRKRQLERAVGLGKALHAFAEENREGNAFSIDRAGRFDWLSRPSVVVHDALKAIAAIKRRGKALASRLLRIKIEIRKNIIQSDPDSIQGIRSLSIEYSDMLKIKPEDSSYSLDYNRKSGEYSVAKPRRREVAEEEA